MDFYGYPLVRANLRCYFKAFGLIKTGLIPSRLYGERVFELVDEDRSDHASTVVQCRC